MNGKAEGTIRATRERLCRMNYALFTREVNNSYNLFVDICTRYCGSRVGDTGEHCAKYNGSYRDTILSGFNLALTPHVVGRRPLFDL